jgi:hypothetical protein
MLDASGIEVDVTNGEVRLSGTVEHREAKRRAEDLAESISGVSNVENIIKVKQDKWSGTDNQSADASSGKSSADSTTKNSDKTKRTSSGSMS